MALWLGCTWLWSLPARAEPVLIWRAPAECPAAQYVQAEIARLLRRPLVRVATELSASVRIRGNARAGYEATVTLGHGQSARPRVLRDPRCAVLAHAAAVVIALAIDPMTELAARRAAAAADANAASGTAEGAPVDPASAPEDAPGAVKVPAVLAAPTAPPATATAAGSVAGGQPSSAVAKSSADLRRSTPARAAPGSERKSETRATPPRSAANPRLLFAVGAGLGAGTLPPPAPWVSVSGGLLGAHWRTAVRIFYAPAQSVTLEDLEGAGGHVGLLAGAVEGGARLRTSIFEFPLLAGFEAGAFHARGEGVPEVENTRPLWFAGFLASGITFAWNAWCAVGVRAEGVVAARRPRFAVQSDLGAVHVFYRPDRLGFRGLLEAELRLR